MSLFGAMNTAMSGLTAQSAAFTNISDNVANSQTVGYKATDTSFSDYLTVSNANENLSGAVVTTPDYTNNVQGTVVQSTDPLAMAITGQGFFPVSQQSGTSSGTAGGPPTFSAQNYYTRAGDFQMNASGFLVNGSGYYLNGWPVSSGGVVDQTQLKPVQISQTQYSPVATTQTSLTANLPATPASGTPITSQLQVYDALGTQHTVTLNWTQNAASNWTVTMTSPDVSGGTIGSADVQFGSAASGNPVPDGTVGNLTNATGSVSASSYSATTPAALSFTANFGNGSQTVSLGLGNYGSSSGLTQYSGTSYTLGGVSQNGVPPGAFQSVTTQANGDVVVNYDNGQSQVVAQVPIATFNAPDQLQKQNGEAYTATTNSGTANVQVAGSNGAGDIVTGSVEQSNVDIATEFSKLIVAQQAYTATAKVVTSANQLLQAVVDMKQ